MIECSARVARVRCDPNKGPGLPENPVASRMNRHVSLLLLLRLPNTSRLYKRAKHHVALSYSGAFRSELCFTVELGMSTKGAAGPRPNSMSAMETTDPSWLNIQVCLALTKLPKSTNE